MKRRPVNLNFFTLHFPVTAWVSIAHRLSGLFLFLMIPVVLKILQESLASEQRFLAIAAFFQHPIIAIGLWLFLATLLYHFIAGIRHLLMDMHVGESKMGGRRGAWTVLSIFIVLIMLAGYKLL